MIGDLYSFGILKQIHILNESAIWLVNTESQNISSRYHRLWNYDVKRTTKIEMGPFKVINMVIASKVFTSTEVVRLHGITQILLVYFLSTSVSVFSICRLTAYVQQLEV